MLAVAIKLPVSHEIEHGLQAVRPLGDGRVGEVQEGIGELHHLFFQDAVAAEKHVIERHAVRRATNFQMSRPPRHHGVVHTIEPVLHTVRRTGVRKAENPEILGIFRRIFRRHGPQGQPVASGRQGGQFRHPHLPVGRQLDAGDDLLPRPPFRRVEDVARHRHLVFPLRPGCSHHPGLQLRKRFPPQHERQALQRQLQAFFRQGEGSLRRPGLPRSAQHRHVHHLPEAEALQPPFCHFDNRDGQDKTSFGIGIDRIQPDRLLPRIPPIEPLRHVRRRRHAGRTQRHAVVVHGHPRQAQRVAGLTTAGGFVQGDFKRRPLVFLHRKGHRTAFRPQHVCSGQSRGRQGESGGNGTHPVALHRLFRHGFPVRVAEFQRQLASGHRLLFAAPLVRTQAAHVHRLPGTIDGPVGIEAFRLPRSAIFLERRRREPSHHARTETVFPLIYFHRKRTPVVLFHPTGGFPPAGLTFRVRHSGMHQPVPRQPFHGSPLHGTARPPVQHGVETGAVRQGAAH